MASSIFGTIATKFLLEDLARGKKWNEEPKYGKLGYQLCKKIFWVDQQIKKSKSKKQIASKWKIPKRFQKRNAMHQFTPESWDNSIEEMTCLIEKTEAAFGTMESEKKKIGKR